MGTLIKNGKVVNATGTVAADVLIEGSTIKEVRAGINEAGHTVVDAAGMYVIPGGIDVHTHLDMPFGGTMSADDYKTGTQAAAAGGTTSVLDFAIQSRGTTMKETLKTWQAKAKDKACVDYGLHMAITDLNPAKGPSDDASLDEMDEMVREGITSFKLFTAYPDSLMVDDRLMFKVMQRAAKLNSLVMVHAENGSAIDVVVEQTLAEGKTAPHYHALSRSTKAEAEATHRAAALGDMAGATVYIVHVSNEDSLREVRRAQELGWRTLAETCTQYLVLCIEEQMPGKSWDEAKYVFTPPLREKKNQQPLWKGLQDHSLAVLSTDHCPFRMSDQKILGKDRFTKIPNGGPGIENRMQVLFHHGVNAGKLTLERFVDVTATAPAKIFGMYPKKGVIAVGSDADIVLWDPNAEFTILAATQTMATDYSMFEGWKVRGVPVKVYSRGDLVAENVKYVGTVGRGKFLKRKTLPEDVMKGHTLEGVAVTA